MAIRAKVYTNRKSEKKLQITGDVKEIAAVIKGDPSANEAFTEVVTAALKEAKTS